ncbi:MAG: hypothetical protein HRU03_08455 [Nanoarchaeales archaeon]|nr:hypothetical protein [Nanoarchaeales archaeon]
MTTETQTIVSSKDSNYSYESNEPLEKFIDQALKESEQDYKNGNYQDFDVAMADLDKEFSQNE